MICAIFPSIFVRILHWKASAQQHIIQVTICGFYMEGENMELLKGKLTLADNVYNRLLTEISNGVYSTGEQLPSEQNLCKLYGVSKTSVRSALQRLEVLGIIETLHGKGSYVKGTASVSGPQTPNIAEIQPYQLLSDKDFEEVWQFRYGMESQALTLFSVRATESDFKALDEIVRRMIDTSTEKDLSHATFDYYSYIYNHCGNRYIANTMNLYQAVLLAYIYTLQITRKQSRSAVVQFHIAKTAYLRKKDAASILKFVTEENVLHMKQIGNS